MSDYVLRQAFLATEDGFLGLVQRKWQTSPQIAAVGSCCLVGAISGQTLYVASLGDSRAVLGSYGRNNGAIQAQQISIEHNASIESIRNELIANHPDDSHIVMLKHGVWRVKGIIQVLPIFKDAFPICGALVLYTHLFVQEGFTVESCLCLLLARHTSCKRLVCPTCFNCKWSKSLMMEIFCSSASPCLRARLMF